MLSMASRLVWSAPTTSSRRTFESAGRSSVCGDLPAVRNGMKITVPRTRIIPSAITISGLPASHPGMPNRIWLFVTRRYTSQTQIGASSNSVRFRRRWRIRSRLAVASTSLPCSICPLLSFSISTCSSVRRLHHAPYCSSTQGDRPRTVKARSISGYPLRRRSAAYVVAMLAEIGSTGYDVMLFLHIASALVAFAPAFAHPLIERQSRSLDAGQIVGSSSGSSPRTAGACTRRR